MKEVVILGGARTAMADYNGTFARLTEIELGAFAAKAALERTGVKPTEVHHVVFGNALQTSGNAIYGARHVGLKAGVPIEVPALTVNRICGSGIQSVITSAQMIQLEEAETVLAGGMESMSQAPHVIRGLRLGLKLGQGQLEDTLMVSLMDGYCGFYMANTAENLAREMGISREEQDIFAIRSQKAADAAFKAGKFADEIVPVEVKGKGGKTLIAEDDHRRPQTTLEQLAALPTAFGKDGFVTAGNASGIVDGGAAVVVASSESAKKAGRRPLGRVLGWSIVGVEPRVMGIGPAPAIKRLLERAGLSLKEIELFEINEAFAAQYLAVERTLGLDRERVNVNGGAIALGHPLGATGTRIILTLLLEMRRRGARYGIASACIGGGQGIAILLEAMKG